MKESRKPLFIYNAGFILLGNFPFKECFSNMYRGKGAR